MGRPRARTISRRDGRTSVRGDGTARRAESPREDPATFASALGAAILRIDASLDLNSVLPYARLQVSDRISAWGLAGTGTGQLTLDLDDGAAERYRADLTMTLAPTGVRGELLTPTEAGGFALALKADAFWVRTESDSVSMAGVGNLAASRADASRLRAVLDGSRTFALAGGLVRIGDAAQLSERLNRQLAGEQKGREIAVLLVGGAGQDFLRRLTRSVAQSLLDEARNRTLGSPLAPTGSALPRGRRFRGSCAGCLRANALPRPAPRRSSNSVLASARPRA